MRVSKVNKLSPVEAAYIAGLFDGEGSLYSNTFKITQGERGIQVLYYAKEVIGCGGVTIHRKAQGNWQAVYTYKLRSPKAIENLMLQLKPYLLIKGL